MGHIAPLDAQPPTRLATPLTSCRGPFRPSTPFTFPRAPARSKPCSHSTVRHDRRSGLPPPCLRLCPPLGPQSIVAPAVGLQMEMLGQTPSMSDLYQDDSVVRKQAFQASPHIRKHTPDPPQPSSLPRSRTSRQSILMRCGYADLGDNRRRREFLVTTSTQRLELCGAPGTQRLVGIRSGGGFTSWTTRQREDRPTHQQHLQCQTLPQPSPHHTTISLRPPIALTGPFLPSRKPRLPLAFPPQACPVAFCPSRRGEKARTWTTKQGLKTHVEAHTAGLLQGQVLEQRIAGGSLQICPVQSRLISSRTRPCCPRSFLASNKLVSQFCERP